MTREQALLLLWTALWLGRAHLATCGSEPLAILRREREKSVLWRIALAAGGAALQLAFLRVSGEPRRRAEHLLTLLPVYLLDAAAVVLLHLADAQLTWPQVALAAVEAPFLTSVFSVLYSHVRGCCCWLLLTDDGGAQLMLSRVCSASSSSTTASRSR